MKPPPLELAEVFRSLGPEFLEREGKSLDAEQRRVFRDLTLCRTAALGGHLEQCARCGHREIAYNSCRNRHCPKCQAAARAEWMRAQAEDLLPVPYFHVVFTLPAQLGPLSLQNKRLIYGLLFRAASETLLEIAADPRHLGARIGFLAVLHTWGQALQHHPHLHCVVPGGGLSPGHGRWVACRRGFFLPVKVLSRLFRRKFIGYLQQAREENRLTFAGQLSPLADAGRFAGWLQELGRREWVVYAKPPFGGPGQVLKYLARYTHRVAIANRRLLALSAGRVTFSWKDYAAGNVRRMMTLAAEEFARRFLQHVLPRGFVRIRHYGLLANRSRDEKLELCRRLLKEDDHPPSGNDRPPGDEPTQSEPSEPRLCPVCRQGRMVIVERIAAAGYESQGLLGPRVDQDSS